MGSGMDGIGVWVRGGGVQKEEMHVTATSLYAIEQTRYLTKDTRFEGVE